MTSKTLRQKYLREAVLNLLVAKVAVRCLPSEKVVSWASRPPPRTRRFSSWEINWISWAVKTASRKSIAHAVCLPQAVAAQRMLRRRGIDSKICLGVAKQGVELIAHAWVEAGSNVVIGDAERRRFTTVAEFGRSNEMSHD